MFRHSCEFLKSVASVDGLPEETLPEIAFAGRSNVGKSSLINALLNQKIAKTSATPGRTRQLNFFNLADKIMIVDLPGYGYAKASKKEIAGWTELTLYYLLNRANLRRIFLLIDSRRGVKENDIEIIDLLEESAVSYQIILTKTDKLNDSELESAISSVKAHFSKYTALYPELIVTSAKKHFGLEDLKDEIARFV